MHSSTQDSILGYYLSPLRGWFASNDGLTPNRKFPLVPEPGGSAAQPPPLSPRRVLEFLHHPVAQRDGFFPVEAKAVADEVHVEAAVVRAGM